MGCIITYQKENGDIFIRPYNSSAFSTFKKVGDETSMGWKIIDIHYKHNDNYYCYEDYIKIFEKQIKEKHNKKLIKFLIKKLSKLTWNV